MNAWVPGFNCQSLVKHGHGFVKFVLVDQLLDSGSIFNKSVIATAVNSVLKISMLPPDIKFDFFRQKYEMTKQ